MGEVSHFGVHRTSSLSFLLQGGGNEQNAWSMGVRSPFVVTSRRSKPCNHNIQLNMTVDEEHLETFFRIAESPLVRAMLPFPREHGSRGYAFMKDHDDRNLDIAMLSLSRLSSPIKNIIYPIWAESLVWLRNEVNITNVQPLVLTGVNATHHGIIDKLSDLLFTSPRTVVLSCEEKIFIDTSRIRMIETGDLSEQVDDLLSLPLEKIGGYLLRLFMRNQLEEKWCKP